LYDNAGRTALRLAIKAFRDKKLTKRNPFEATYRLLARQPVKVKIGSRMVKLDPSGMEWFLLNYCLIEYRQMFTELDRKGMPGFTAPMLEILFARFPDAVLPQHRKKRAYLSAMLSKNEVFGSSPYNRQIFVRVGHGIYVLNPMIDLGVRDEWKPVGDMMGLTEMLETMGTLGERAQKAWTDLRTRTISTPEKMGRGG
jgi:hypothetical protein